MTTATPADKRIILIAWASDNRASASAAAAFCEEATNFRPAGEGFATRFSPVEADMDIMQAAGFSAVCASITSEGGVSVVVWARRSIPESWDSGNRVCGAMFALDEKSAVELAQMVSRAVL